MSQTDVYKYAQMWRSQRSSSQFTQYNDPHGFIDIYDEFKHNSSFLIDFHSCISSNISTGKMTTCMLDKINTVDLIGALGCQYQIWWTQKIQSTNIISYLLSRTDLLGHMSLIEFPIPCFVLLKSSHRSTEQLQNALIGQLVFLLRDFVKLDSYRVEHYIQVVHVLDLHAGVMSILSNRDIVNILTSRKLSFLPWYSQIHRALCTLVDESHHRCEHVTHTVNDMSRKVLIQLDQMQQQIKCIVSSTQSELPKTNRYNIKAV